MTRKHKGILSSVTLNSSPSYLLDILWALNVGCRRKATRKKMFNSTNVWGERKKIDTEAVDIEKWLNDTGRERKTFSTEEGQNHNKRWLNFDIIFMLTFIYDKKKYEKFSFLVEMTFWEHWSVPASCIYVLNIREKEILFMWNLVTLELGWCSAVDELYLINVLTSCHCGIMGFKDIIERC